MAQTETKTVYDMIREAIDKGDTRFHRRLDASWLKQYVAGASNFDTLTEDDWRLHADAAANMVTKIKREKIRAAVEILEDSVNGSDKDLVVEAIGGMHRTLMDSLATAVMDAINMHTRSRSGDFDGRIGVHFQNFIKEYWPDPFIGK